MISMRDEMIPIGLLTLVRDTRGQATERGQTIGLRAPLVPSPAAP